MHIYFFAVTVFSAALYAGAFLFLDTFWWCSFLFLVPVFVICSDKKLKHVFWYGFLWGLVTYSAQLSALFYFIYMRITHLLGWCVPISIVLLMACSAGFWFWLLQNIFLVFKPYFEKDHNFFSIKNMFMQMLSIGAVCIACMLFFMWIHTAVLIFLIGDWYGYPFSLPLLPAFYGSACMQWLVSAYGIWVSMGLLIFAQVSFVICMRFKSRIALLLVLTVFSCLAWQYFRQHKTLSHDSKLTDLVIACTIPEDLFFQKHSMYDRAVELCTIVYTTQEFYPYARVLVLPESIFPYADGFMHTKLAEMLGQCCHPETYVLLGVYRKGTARDCKEVAQSATNSQAMSKNFFDGTYNSCMCIYQSRIIKYYDKKLLIPFFEYVPHYWSDILFSINGTDFTPGMQSSCFVSDGSGQEYVVKICAELFWHDTKNDDYKKFSIIALVNDAHFAHSYFKKLMYLWACCQACGQGQELIYSRW